MVKIDRIVEVGFKKPWF